MKLLNKLVVLLLLAGFCAPAFSAVDSIKLISCSVYSESEEGKKEGEAEEEEPDCE